MPSPMSTENKETLPSEKVPGSHTTSIPNKLLEFQKRVSAISKDSVNPFFKSKYFDVNTVIDTIKPILNEVGLVITQGLDHSNGHNMIVTKVMDGRECLAISEMLIPEQTDVQKLGAAITYCRRYSLVSLLLLQGEDDDDGNAAVKPNPAITAPIKGSPDKDATDKQKFMIKSLMKQKGVTKLSDLGLAPKDGAGNLTSEYASQIIKELMDLKPIVEIDQDYPA